MPNINLAWQYCRTIARVLANFVLTAALVVLSLSFKTPALPKTIAYGFFREIAKKNMELKTTHWPSLRGEHFVVRYRPEDAGIARLVLSTAEEAYKPVGNMLDFAIKHPVPVVVYPTREQLSQSFGWDADESAMGVYWAGVIRILSPSDWVEAQGPEEMARIFKHSGPMVHEYAHLAVDYRTRGNYPRWLTEGVAQYVEKKVTGFQFPQVDGKGRWYPLEQMDSKFDLLPDQSLAYSQSLLAVEYLVEVNGFQSLNRLLDALGEGKILSQALYITTGQDLKQFEQNFRQWLDP